MNSFGFVFAIGKHYNANYIPHQGYFLFDADRHNFGKITSQSGSSVIKYRNCLPERLFLGADSDLRRDINHLYKGDLLPALSIEGTYQDGPHLFPVTFERLEVTPLSKKLLPEESRQVGAFIALAAWLGLSDCHQGNLLAGHRNGQFVFSSMDWETILNTLPFPYDLAFFRAERGCMCAGNFCKSYGLSTVAGFASVADVLTGHAQMTEILLQSELEKKVMGELNGKSWVRRAVIRDSFKYAEALKSGARDFYPEENLQLDRGEIPYFFQIAGKEDIYYWVSTTEYRPVEKSKWAGLPAKTFKEPSYPEELQREVERNIIRSLDEGAPRYEIRNEEYCVTYKDSLVYLEGPTGRTFARRTN